MRVVLDTNVLVSGIAYPSSVPGRIVDAWRRGGIDVVLSRPILDELARVLPRLNHRLGWTDTDFADFIDLVAISAELASPKEAPQSDLRDPTDLPILGTLLASGADCLITGDRDLLALASRFPIVSPAAFWERYGG